MILRMRCVKMESTLRDENDLMGSAVITMDVELPEIYYTAFRRRPQRL